MKKLIAMTIGLLISSNLFAIVSITGERESFQVMLKLELIRDDNTSVTILDGSKYVELKTDSNTTGIGTSLAAIRPDDGIYTKIKYTVYKFKHKLYVSDGVTTYYTTNKSIAMGESWALSPNINEYGYTETIPATPLITEVILPKPLDIVSGSDASLVFINKYDNGFNIDYNSSLGIDQAIWVDEPTIATAFLPDIPAQTITFDLLYRDSNYNIVRQNTITLFLDENNALTGGYMMRPVNAALNGSFLLQGTSTPSTTSSIVSYFLSFQNGNDNDDNISGDDYYDINITIDCPSNTYVFVLGAIPVDEFVDGVSVGDKLITDNSLTLDPRNLDVKCNTISLP